MRKTRWLALLVGLLACGLIAAGCGDDEESTSSTPVTSEGAASEDSTSEDSTSGADSDEVDSDGVYEACVDAIEGSLSEDQAISTCEDARTSFEQCADQAASSGGETAESAAQICKDAAEQTIAALEAAPPSSGY